jgi:hypothetical protein
VVVGENESEWDWESQNEVADRHVPEHALADECAAIDHAAFQTSWAPCPCLARQRDRQKITAVTAFDRDETELRVSAPTDLQEFAKDVAGQRSVELIDVVDEAIVIGLVDMAEHRELVLSRWDARIREKRLISGGLHMPPQRQRIATGRSTGERDDRVRLGRVGSVRMGGASKPRTRQDMAPDERDEWSAEVVESASSESSAQ